MLKRIEIIIAVIFCLLFQNVSAQTGDQPDVNEPSAGNFFGVGARAMGMGGAYIAVANDATALVYNPAGLAQVRRIEFSGGLTHQGLKNRTGYFDSAIPYYNNSFLQSNTRFSSGNIVLPVPTYRGSLVFALGVNRIGSFDRTLDYVNPQEHHSFIRSESGGLYAWSFGGAVDLSPQVSIGGALNFWSGKYDYSLLADSAYYLQGGLLWSYRYNDAITDRYSGWNVKLGARIQPNKFLVIGGTIETPVTYTIKEDWLLLTDTVFYQPVYQLNQYPPGEGNSEYKFTLPFTLGFGVAINLRDLTLATDLVYTDWTQMEYKRLAEKSDANRIIKEVYKDVLRWHMGVEYTIPQIGTCVRAGYFQNPFPYNSPWIKSDRRYLTGGFGILIDQVTTIDLAWVHGSWETNDFSKDLASKYTTNQIFLSMAYRF
jgi:long-chain fatty acid transport protein